MASRVDAVVVGSGPNGLAAALVLAGAGLEVEVHEAQATIGGGARTEEVVAPGYLHDLCSAVHPLGLASPFFRRFDLAGNGVEMLQPQVAYAHPLDGGRAGLAWRDLDRTVDGLGADGPAFRSLVGPLAERWQGLVEALLSDFRHVPRDLPVLLRAGLGMLEQGSPAWNLRWREEVAPAMLTGVANHAIAPPRAIAPAGAGLLLAALAHGVGWPLPRGGSQRIVDAMTAELRRRGGRVLASSPVRRLEDLPAARAVLFDTSPVTLLEVVGDRLPPLYRRWLRGFRYGGAACKVDFTLSQPVPWAAAGCELAGTLHLGGTREQSSDAEREVAAGRHPERPFVLAVQPGVVDPTRAPEGQHTLWTYAHVPHGSDVDMADAVQAQVERFAPGFGDVVTGRATTTGMGQERKNANYVGGDIAGGAPTPWQMVARPTPTWDPYRTPLPGVYLCSASVPPGPAVHGMGGLHAAGRVLRQRFGIDADPLDLVA
jgi:phytoene dehydrogenase-like protein